LNVRTEGTPAEGRPADADARAADRLEHARADRHEVLVDARTRDGVDDLARAGGDGELHARVDDRVAQRRGDDGEVLVRGVDGRAHAHLGDGRAGQLGDGHDVAGDEGRAISGWSAPRSITSVSS
jgi:hypothetical protein